MADELQDAQEALNVAETRDEYEEVLESFGYEVERGTTRVDFTTRSPMRGTEYTLYSPQTVISDGRESDVVLVEELKLEKRRGHDDYDHDPDFVLDEDRYQGEFDIKDVNLLELSIPNPVRGPTTYQQLDAF